MMQIYKIIIAEKIRDFRKEKRLSQSEFGKLIGVSAQAVSKWEKNKCCPDAVIFPNIASILECRTDDFFEII